MTINRVEPYSNDEVWVEVETNKGVSAVSTYRGRTTRREVDAWAEGRLKDHCLRLQDVYWIEDLYTDDLSGAGEPVIHQQVVVPGQTPGRYANCTGELLIRTDTITIIMFMRDGSERRRGKEQAGGQLVRLAPKGP